MIGESLLRNIFGQAETLKRSIDISRPGTRSIPIPVVCKDIEQCDDIAKNATSDANISMAEINFTEQDNLAREIKNEKLSRISEFAQQIVSFGFELSEKSYSDDMGREFAGLAESVVGFGNLLTPEYKQDAEINQALRELVEQLLLWIKQAEEI